MTFGKEISVLSFFAGIGGIELGLEWAGSDGSPSGWPDVARPPESIFRAVGQIELELYALSVLYRRWPGVPRLGDITKLPPNALPEADLWCGGFPCQDISTAGKRAGIIGSRSGLFFDWARLIESYRPPMVLMENVGALLFRGLDAVLAELARIGYDAEWECVPAAAVGARHRRDRVFILALSPDAPFPAGCWAGPARMNLLESLRRKNENDVWSADPGMERLVPRTQIVEDRLERLGNAVVPQAAELLGTMLLDPLPKPFAGSPFAVLENGMWMENRRSAFGGFPFSGQWPRSGTMAGGVASGRWPCLCPLITVSQVWPTPTGMDSAMIEELGHWEERQEKWKGKGVNLQRPLGVAVQQDAYPTPSGWDGTNPGGSFTLSRSLLWPTPRETDFGGPRWKTEKTMADSRFSSMLSSEVLAEDSGWFQTPTGSDGPMGGGGFGRDTVGAVEDSGRISSLTQAERVRRARQERGKYPTPKDSDGPNMQGFRDIDGVDRSAYSKTLSTVARVAEVGEDGILPKDVRLNPEWVEWLMGFPRGWTEV